MTSPDIHPPQRPVTYLQLPPGERHPEIAHLAPFQAVVIVDAEVDSHWQNATSAWLVRSGCLYMMAWGRECSSWDDSVDWAYIDDCPGEATPDHRLIVTTWHEKESLKETFWFSKRCAIHPTVDLKNTLLLHIAVESQETKLLKIYAKA